MMKNNVLWHCATLFSVGLLPGGGTVASFLALPFYFLHTMQLGLVLLVSALISLSAISFGQAWYQKKDPSQIVIDEFVAALLLLFVLKVFFFCSLQQAVLALVVFRFFDATKIWGIRNLEHVQGIWGVLLDDLGAALYSCIIFYLLL